MPQHIEHQKLLYSVAEAAELLSLSRPTLYKLIQSGQIVAVYPTSKARVSAAALNRFVARLENGQRSQRDELGRSLR